MKSLFPEISKKSLNNVILLCRNGRTKGYAFVYLKDAKDAEKVIEYVDGRHIRSRQVRVKRQLGDDTPAAATSAR